MNNRARPGKSRHDRNGKEKPTFGSRLKEKRIAKGWSQHQLAALAGCTNSNISYLESHPNQQPKLKTVEGLARALDWDINEARRLAGYSESDDNLSPLEVEDEFRLALYGYKQLSERVRELVRKQIRQIIDFASACAQETDDPGVGISFEEQAEAGAGDDVTETTVGGLNKRMPDRKKNNKKK